MSRWRALASPNWSRAASSWPESWLSARSPAGERGSLSYWLEILWKVYVPLARPTYLAYGLVSISHHWDNFIRPLEVTNSVEILLFQRQFVQSLSARRDSLGKIP